VIPIAIPFTARSLAEGGVFLAPKVVPGTPGLPLEVAFFLPSARSLSASGRVAASLMPRVRHRSKAVDIDHGQLVGRHLNRFAIVMHLHELAPGGWWAASRRDGWRFQRLAEVCQNILDRPGLRDEGDQPDVTAAVWALERKLLPNPGQESRPRNP